MTYAPGQRVRVSARMPVGHHRTPGYLKGKSGTVRRVHGAFTNPEGRAYGADGLPKLTLYQVAFAQHELWPSYHGDDRDILCVDLFEHWLEEDQ